MSFSCAVLRAIADAGISSPSHPFVLFRLFFEIEELSSVSREGESAIASEMSVVSPVVVTCAVSGGSTESSRLTVANANRRKHVARHQYGLMLSQRTKRHPPEESHESGHPVREVASQPEIGQRPLRCSNFAGAAREFVTFDISQTGQHHWHTLGHDSHDATVA